MDVVGFCNGKQVDEEIDLHEGLAAGDGDPAALVKTFIAPVLLENFCRLHKGPAFHGPGIGIVAVGAAHGTTLDENHETDARAVHGAETFQGMDSAFHKYGLPPLFNIQVKYTIIPKKKQRKPGRYRLSEIGECIILMP